MRHCSTLGGVIELLKQDFADAVLGGQDRFDLLHHVMASEGGKYKYIKFGDENAQTAGKPKAGESEAMKKKRKSFKARHAKNIARGKMSAAYWADKEKW